jgi:pentatricopeptide repeat protein
MKKFYFFRNYKIYNKSKYYNKFLTLKPEKADEIQNTIFSYLHYNDYEEAEKIYHYLEIKGIMPDKTIVFLFLEYFLQKKLNSAGIEFYYKYMKKYNPSTSPNLIMFVINFHINMGNIIEAENILKNDLIEKNVRPNSKIILIFIEYYIKKKDINTALEYLKIVYELKIKPDNKLYVPIISYYLKSENIEKAEMLYNEMKRLEISPNSKTFHEIIIYFFKKLNFEKTKLYLTDYRLSEKVLNEDILKIERIVLK